MQIGFSKTILSRGEFAEILADNRSFTEREQALFDESAEFAYRSFRDKAAASRGMEPEEMQELAQGRVWIGSDARSRKYGGRTCMMSFLTGLSCFPKTRPNPCDCC